MANDLTALVLACSLKKSPAPFSSEQLGTEELEQLRSLDIDGEVVRVVNHNVRVSDDEGDGDEWLALRARLLAADALVLAAPI